MPETQEAPKVLGRIEIDTTNFFPTDDPWKDLGNRSVEEKIEPQVVYDPVEPYYYEFYNEETGQDDRRCLDFDFIHFPQWIIWTYGKLKAGQFEARKKFKESEEFIRHVAWLIKQEKKITAGIKCPYCVTEKSRYFSAFLKTTGVATLSLVFSCCENSVCRKELKEVVSKVTNGRIFPLRFSFLADDFFDKTNKTKPGLTVEFMKSALGLPRNLTPKMAFEFFKYGRLL